MKKPLTGVFPSIRRRTLGAVLILFLVFCSATASPRTLGVRLSRAGQGAALGQDMQEAKAMLQSAVNKWSQESLKAARDRFINCLMKAKTDNVYILYHIALADYRLVTFYLSSKANEDAEKSLIEAEKYLEKATTLDASFGEASALYGYLLGFEIALHPERAMTLGPDSFEHLAKGLAKEPENPRIHLLQGISLFYTPHEYGGGVDSALGSLAKAASLFEKEVVKDPFKPSWGKDEAYTYLGVAYKQKKEYARAKEMFLKALKVNPESGLAKKELSDLEKIDGPKK